MTDAEPSRELMLGRILKESNRQSDAQQSKQPLGIAMFPLMITFFQEEHRLYKICDTSLTDEAVEMAVNVTTPLVIIKGMSLYTKDAQCFVAIVKKICFKTTNTLHALLIAFLSYFVFRLQYPPECKRTLEFLQR